MSNSIDWDEIPEDVEAIVTYYNDVPSHYKMIGGILHVQLYKDGTYHGSCSESYDGLEHCYGDRLHLRPKPLVSNEFDWGSVDNDIEAVVLSETGELIHIYRTIRGNLHFANPEWEELSSSAFNSLQQVALSCKESGNIFIMKPINVVGEVEDKYVPSINDILQEAQQAILQHHNINGKVTFTVTTE